MTASSLMSRVSNGALWAHRFATHAFTAHAIFWSWNGIFLTFAYLGLLPTILPDFIRDMERGLLPAPFAITLGIIVLIPTLATVWGVRLRKDPRALLRLFYGLEMPLFFLAILRLFVVRQAPPALTWMAVCAVVGLAGYAFGLTHGGVRVRHVFQRKWFKRRADTPVAVLRTGAATSLLTVGTHVSLVVLLHVVPLAWMALVGVLGFQWVPEVLDVIFNHPERLFFVGLGTLLFAYSCTLLFALPVVAMTLYAQTWWESVRALARRIGARWAHAVALVAMLGVLAGYGGFGEQPQHGAFAALEGTPQTDAERRERLVAGPEIREGLLNAYLASYRYMSSTGSADHLPSMYREAFGGDRETYAAVQEGHNTLASPWLYEGENLYQDSQKAAVAYRDFFDAPIQKAEQDEVLAALTSSFDRSSVEAGLLDRDARNVWLVEQSVHVEERGDLARVEIHEVYENQTTWDEEVLYYFSLPESAVVTGLWLGESADKSLAFTHVVAPRGAAQQVYRNEVRRSVDPALLEQVGPRQYRLKAFPIPQPRYDELGNRIRPQMHLWLEYHTMAQGGAWPLPRLLERRNVFWTADTVRRVNDEVVPNPGDGWLWPQVEARADASAQSHDVVVAGGYVVRATPLSADERDEREAATPHAKRIALVLDRSRSMDRFADEVSEDLRWAQRSLAPQNQVDVILTAAPSRGEMPSMTSLDAAQDQPVVYYGGQSTSELLAQFAELSADRRYDAVLVLTDDGGFDMEDEQPQSYHFEGAVWFVHVGEELPTGYDDGTLEAIQRGGGGVAYSIREAMNRWGREAAHRRILDGYRWDVVGGRVAEPAGSRDDAFAQLAAGHVIRTLVPQTYQSRATLDDLHEVAVRHDVVSPYSSMIVLVNQRQREALKKASEADDRFQRETETGEQGMGGPGDMLVSGVPEPEEWLLIFVALLGLVYYMRKSTDLTAVLRPR